ncbi:MAG: hypothetical protein DRN12_05995 [Thermoplasmata archaeon]|nr:MAG: hypothetical protein DRN12_05995 [Thermoplasmata archaeon]
MYRKVFVFMLIVFFIGVCIGSTTSGKIDIGDVVSLDGDDRIDQQQTDSNGGDGMGADGKMAQSFTPSLPILTRVELLMRRIGNPSGDVKVSIRSSVDGRDLTSISIPAVDLPTSYNWVEFDFHDILVIPGRQYYIVFHQCCDYLFWGCIHKDRYPGGEAWYYGESVQWNWEPAYKWDFAFKTYGRYIIDSKYSSIGGVISTLQEYSQKFYADNMVVAGSDGDTIVYVPDDYPSIQEAINHANTGDTIIVRDGIYTENIKVNKSGLTIKSENGPNLTIVKAADSDNHIFDVAADNVSIIGFTIEGATGENGIWIAGLYIHDSYHCSVYNNIFQNDWYGVRLSHVSNSILIDNIANNNKNVGFIISYSHNNIIMDNQAYRNMSTGILLGSSSYNVLFNNTANNNRDFGIRLYTSSGNFLSNNTASNNKIGIYLDYSSKNNILINNTVDDNNGGIYLHMSSKNTLLIIGWLIISVTLKLMEIFSLIFTMI